MNFSSQPNYLFKSNFHNKIKHEKKEKKYSLEFELQILTLHFVPLTTTLQKTACIFSPLLYPRPT